MSKQSAPLAPGAIVADAMYTMAELCGRLGWGVNDVSLALEKGLRFYRFLDVTYVFGSDAMKFIKAQGHTAESGEA